MFAKTLRAEQRLPGAENRGRIAGELLRGLPDTHTTAGFLTGLFSWWAIGDYVGGIVVGVGLFFAAISTGW